MLLAGVLVTNTVLTTFNIAPGASLANPARSALGEALLNNPGSRVAFCNDFGLHPNVDTCEFDLSKTELKEVEPFRLLAGCLRGNRTLTHVTLKQLRMEQIATLALALRGNDTLAQLDIIHTSRLGGETIVRLPVPELNGSKHKEGDSGKLVDMSETCIEGGLGRVACAMIGTLIAPNTTLECLDLSNTGVGAAIGTEGEGGHILLRPMFESKVCPLNEINLTNTQLNDKAGGKLLSALSVGLGKKVNGYEKLTSLILAHNDLGKQTTAALKSLLWSERAPCVLQKLDLRGNIGLDGYETALAIKRNESLTSLDIRDIPSANKEDIYTFLGAFLLQEECGCRLGQFACDAFSIQGGLAELVLKPAQPESPNRRRVAIEEPPADDDGARAPDRSRVTNAVLMLLAGVLKFNSSLKNLVLADCGVGPEAAGYFATALLENTALERLDLSHNQLDDKGISEIAASLRSHKAMVEVKIDGNPILISQVRGAKGEKETIDFADSSLGALSGHAIGTIATANATLTNLNLKHNSLGAAGASACVAGLGEAPLKTLDLTRNGIGDSDAAAMEALSMSICQHLGALIDLRLDENDLDCSGKELAPVCKLRNLRTLSLEKNRLSEVPALIGTMLSLRRVSLHSNQIVELPPALCLLSGLESLDVHKNSIRALPNTIGNLKSLQKLEISENKIVELPISICELSEEMSLSVGRNPLEKPSVEQARQGVGAIRRFFGWSKKKEDGDSKEEAKPVLKEEGDEHRQHVERPKGRGDEAPSRHDWAPPGAVILLFNCHKAAFGTLEGSQDLSTVPPNESVELIATFNLQCVGRVREARHGAETWQERLEFASEWLPWKVNDISASDDAPTVSVTVKWQVFGQPGRSQATLLVTPWLAYGCSVGARVKRTHGYATVIALRKDDMVEIRADNSLDRSRTETLDPRPDTMSRTSSPSYKAGQKLLLLHEGAIVDAVVEEWLGVRHGSAHRVRLGGGGRTSTSAAKAKERAAFEVDLNESNHAKLLFSTGAKYNASCADYLDKLAAKHCTVRDDTTAKDLSVSEQRLFLGAYTPPVPADEASASADGRTTPPLGGGDGRTSPPPAEGGEGGRRTPPARSTPPPFGDPSEEPPTSAVALFRALLSAKREDDGVQATVLRAHSRPEQELLHNQALFTLTDVLRSGELDVAIKPLPVSLSMASVAAMLTEEKRAPVRDMLVRAFELEYPTHADMLRQAMELRALVIIAEVREEADLLGFSAAVLDELFGNKLVVVMGATGLDGAPMELPAQLQQHSEQKVVKLLGVYMNNFNLSDTHCRIMFKRMRQRTSTAQEQSLALEYGAVSSLHVGGCEVGPLAMQELHELLTADTCALSRLDVSCTILDSSKLVAAIKGNRTLTSLDVRWVPHFHDHYEALGLMLLPGGGSKCPLGYLRCDAFDVPEGESVLSLRECPLDQAATRLLTAVLRNNASVHDLDLSATDLEPDGASLLIKTLITNDTLTTLRVGLNSALTEEAQASLLALAKHEKPSMTLEF